MLKQRYGYIVLITVCLLLIAPMMFSASAYADWSGVWSTNYGDLTIKYSPQEGYTGTFGQYGNLQGKITDEWGYVIRGTWTDNSKSGTFEFRMDYDMKEFQGWRNTPEDVWKGTRDIVPEPTC